MKVLKAIIETINNWNGKTKNGQLEEADAIILEFHLTGSTKNGMSEARLLLQVLPPSGRNYVTECYKYFDDVHLRELNHGTKTKIYFRQNDPSKIRWLKNVKPGV